MLDKTDHTAFNERAKRGKTQCPLPTGKHKFLRLCHMVAMGLNHKPEIPTGQTGEGERDSRV